MENPCCEAAKMYLAAGLSVVPIMQDKSGQWKAPAVEWKEFRTRLATVAEVDAWWAKFPDARVGIVTGKLSGIVVVDIDPRHGGLPEGVQLPATLTVKTGGGGWHYYYRYPTSGQEVKNAVGIKKGIDIRAEGGIVVAPPSIHHSGQAYEWPQGFDCNMIAECPDWVFAEQQKTGLSIEDVIGGVSEGRRNEAAAMVCGRLLGGSSPKDWETKTWPTVMQWNQKNTPPLEITELRAVFDHIKVRDFAKRSSSVDETASENNPNFTYSNLLIKSLKEEEGIALFYDEETERAYMRYTRQGVNECQPILSKTFQGFAGEMARIHLGKSLRAQQLRDVADSLDLEAHSGGTKVKTALRVRQDSDTIRYDLADDERRVVTVTATGWSVGKTNEFLFRRYGFTLPQPVPDQSGDLEPLFRLVKTYSQEDKLLLICYLVSCFVPDIQHPILHVTGPKGSAKSTFTNIIRSLIDPSKLYHASLTQTEDGIGIAASQNWVVVFDNVDVIKPHISDLLCRLCTGDAIGKRRFFTNDELMVRSYRRCVMLNGINPLARRTDLADRVVWFRLRPIMGDDRRTESEILHEFGTQRARILGGIFNLLSEAMRLVRSVDRKNLHRLADFDVWGRAIAQAAGYDPLQFAAALQNNRESLNYESIRQSPVAAAMIDLMAKRPEWSGSPTAFYEILRQIAEARRDDTRTGAWPQNAGALSLKLNEVEVELAELGIRFVHSHTGKERKITIYADAVPETTENAP